MVIKLLVELAVLDSFIASGWRRRRFDYRSIFQSHHPIKWSVELRLLSSEGCQAYVESNVIVPRGRSPAWTDREERWEEEEGVRRYRR